jgi:hypothetical protein
MLRFSPIIIQLIDDIFTEVKLKDDVPKKEDSEEKREKVVIPPPLVDD